MKDTLFVLVKCDPGILPFALLLEVFLAPLLRAGKSYFDISATSSRQPRVYHIVIGRLDLYVSGVNRT